jgi:hypothetical protein
MRSCLLQLILRNKIQSCKHGLQNRPPFSQHHLLPERAEIIEQREYLPRFGLRRRLQAL